MRKLEERLNNIPLAPEAASTAMAISPPAEAPPEYWHISIETLVVVLAVITIVASVGRCLDGGGATVTEDKPPVVEAKASPTEEPKK
ncbi:hypothetical protein LINGRAHAP2_LOCUS20202 [Linum grandiflorum]